METNTGIYGYTRETVIARFAERISGSASGLLLVLADNDPSEASRNALCKSAQSLGWSPHDITFVRTSELEARDIFEIIEGIDPIALVITGRFSTRLFCEAYRIDPATLPLRRIFCRETRIIPEMEDLLLTPEGKQRIWAEIKTLPRA